MTAPSHDPTQSQTNSIGNLSQLFGSTISFRDPLSAFEAVEAIRAVGLTDDLLEFLCTHLGTNLGKTPDPDSVISRLARFITRCRSPQATVLLFQRDSGTLTALMNLFSSSAYLAECLIDDPDSLDLLRITGGQPIDRSVLADEIFAECIAADTVEAAQATLRRHRRRETLRIAYGDIVQGQALEQTCEQLTFLADAILSAAIATSHHLLLRESSGFQVRDTQTESQPQFTSSHLTFCFIALGSYGSKELDYFGPLDILILSSKDAGYEDGVDKAIDSAVRPELSQLLPTLEEVGEFGRRTAELVVKMLSTSDHLGPAYNFNFRLRVHGEHIAIQDSFELIRFFQLSGRTWHRQELTNARVAAGNFALGSAFLNSLQSFIYRRYLGTADQEGIRGIKRKVARWSETLADRDANSKRQAEQDLLDITQSAAREIEYVIRFLQLLNGSDLPQVRVSSTCRAIEALEQAGCLTMKERTLLVENYLTFRRFAHRLELANFSSHEIESEGNAAAREFADDLSHSKQLTTKHSYQILGTDGQHDRQTIRADLVRRRSVCRRIVDHLMHDVFTEAAEIPIETEMVLDPDFDAGDAEQVLAKYGFSSTREAYDCLLSLSTETVRFLSDRRSRHFLAGIAPKLLEEISGTPHPDLTLKRFAAISDSLGGKAALFELFQTNPSTLRLCVRLCATSPYLTKILTNNPGMLDELIDSLLLDRLPQYDELENNAIELCRFAEDVDPILHSLKNSAHLRIGARDVLGRAGIRETHLALSNAAEVCLRRLADDEWDRMVDFYGLPQNDAGQVAGLSIVALGKLGGREPNYHSDLDVLFLYDADGKTRPLAGGRRDSVPNSQFFHELTQRIYKRVNHFGPWGRLFELDSRIRFSHDRNSLVVTIDQFRRHFRENRFGLWQRLALVNARLIYSTEDAGASVGGASREIHRAIREALLFPSWRPEMAAEAAELRSIVQRGAAHENIKRGVGGTLDVEAIVQMLLLRRAAEINGDLGIGTLDGIDLLRARGWLDVEKCQQLSTGYTYLRCVESNLRLMDLPARHDLPNSPEQLSSLAFAMRETHWSIVSQKCEAYREIHRQLLETIFSDEAGCEIHFQQL